MIKQRPIPTDKQRETIALLRKASEEALSKRKPTAWDELEASLTPKYGEKFMPSGFSRDGRML